jgi:predicted small lipoprotein YifL
MRASLTALASVLLSLACLSAAGCGLKGDLYLPDEGASQETTTTEQAGEEDASEENSGG